MGRLISYLDTVVVLRLHAGDIEKLSARAKAQIEKSDLLISAMVVLEMEMLYERGKLKYTSERIFTDLSQEIGLMVCQIPMAAIVRAATAIKWTREPGDRLITANAIANRQASLVTSDRSILENYKNSVW